MKKRIRKVKVVKVFPRTKQIPSYEQTFRFNLLTLTEKVCEMVVVLWKVRAMLSVIRENKRQPISNKKRYKIETIRAVSWKWAWTQRQPILYCISTRERYSHKKSNQRLLTENPFITLEKNVVVIEIFLESDNGLLGN